MIKEVVSFRLFKDVKEDLDKLAHEEGINKTDIMTIIFIDGLKNYQARKRKNKKLLEQIKKRAEFEWSKKNTKFMLSGMFWEMRISEILRKLRVYGVSRKEIIVWLKALKVEAKMFKKTKFLKQLIEEERRPRVKVRYIGSGQTERL